MITKEAWYEEIEKTPNARDVATMFWGELQTRDPKATLDWLEGNKIRMNLRGYILEFQPLAEDLYQITKAGGEFKERRDVLEEYGLLPGLQVGTEDIFRFVIDLTDETSWSDQIAHRAEARNLLPVESREATPKYLIKDKRSQGKPNKNKLKVRPFQPHFGVGPTYYGIIDTSCMSWLKDHEYQTEAEAKRALANCKSGKAPLEFRGF